MGDVSLTVKVTVWSAPPSRAKMRVLPVRSPGSVRVVSAIELTSLAWSFTVPLRRKASVRSSSMKLFAAIARNKRTEFASMTSSSMLPRGSG